MLDLKPASSGREPGGPSPTAQLQPMLFLSALLTFGVQLQADATYTTSFVPDISRASQLGFFSVMLVFASWKSLAILNLLFVLFAYRMPSEVTMCLRVGSTRRLTPFFVALATSQPFHVLFVDQGRAVQALLAWRTHGFLTISKSIA